MRGTRSRPLPPWTRFLHPWSPRCAHLQPRSTRPCVKRWPVGLGTTSARCGSIRMRPRAARPDIFAAYAAGSHVVFRVGEYQLLDTFGSRPARPRAYPRAATAAASAGPWFSVTCIRRRRQRPNDGTTLNWPRIQRSCAASRSPWTLTLRPDRLAPRAPSCWTARAERRRADQRAQGIGFLRSRRRRCRACYGDPAVSATSPATPTRSWGSAQRGLGRQRADAVRDILLEAGVPATSLASVSAESEAPRVETP